MTTTTIPPPPSSRQPAEHTPALVGSIVLQHSLDHSAQQLGRQAVDAGGGGPARRRRRRRKACPHRLCLLLLLPRGLRGLAACRQAALVHHFTEVRRLLWGAVGREQESEAGTRRPAAPQPSAVRRAVPAGASPPGPLPSSASSCLLPAPRTPCSTPPGWQQRRGRSPGCVWGCWGLHTCRRSSRQQERWGGGRGPWRALGVRRLPH